MVTISKRTAGIFFAALIVAVGGLVYELIISTAASYLLGDSVTQFSITIGLMLFAMGIGAMIAPKLRGSAEDQFVTVETLLALIGGNSVAFLYSAYTYLDAFYVLFVLLVLAVGVLIGLEIPIMLKLLKSKKDMVEITSRILSLDYFGALIAAVAYPLILLPQLGVMRSAYLVGLLNVGIAGIMIWLFYQRLTKPFVMITTSVLTTVVLLAGLVFHSQIALFFNHKLYQDDVILSQQTKYQQVVMTRFKNDIRLYLDGNIQFSSVDEYRYHEPLVHVPMLVARNPQKILVLGGGDGLAVREVLKYDSVDQVTVVELDPVITSLAQSDQLLLELNQASLADSKVTVLNQDAFSYLENSTELYDVIILDLPDPNNETLAKLYSQEMYQLVKKNLAADGVMVTQATSPYFTNKAYWLINQTIAAAGFSTEPYHNDVPSFGEWGFILAASERNILASSSQLSQDQQATLSTFQTRFLRAENWPSLFIFDPDLSEPDQLEYIPSTLFNPTITQAYEQEVIRWQ